MNKKDSKFYESPVCEVVELKLQGILCASGSDNVHTEIPVEEPEE